MGYGRSANSETRKRIIVRLVKLMAMCESYQYLPTLDELGSQFRVNPRTVRRDLEAIEEAGVPVPPRLDQREELA